MIQRCDEVIENTGMRHNSHACYHTTNPESRIFVTIKKIAITVIGKAIGVNTLVTGFKNERWLNT